MQQYGKIIAIFLIVSNIVTFFVYGLDKWKAKRFKWRITETALLVLAALGGSIGACEEIRLDQQIPAAA